jgi:ribonuclease VapC
VSEAIVLDASAVVAILNAEPGHAEAIAALPNAVVGAVNLSEVVAKLAERGMPAAEAFRDALALGFAVAPFDAGLALAAGALRPLTRAAGLSLGDRCCLALGQQRRALVLTTEPAWLTVSDAIGVRVRNIRPTG